MKKKRMKKIGFLALSLISLVVLTGCGQSVVTEKSTGVWEKFIWLYGSAIKMLSFGGNIAIGIILFTLIIRVILLPLMHFQTKSMRKMQELQPEVKKLQEKYPGKDTESRRLLQDETQRLYAENNVNQFAGCLPLLVQMPILMALYQAIYRIPALQAGTFLWLKLGEADPSYLLPILAALFTFASSWLSMKASPEQNGMTKAMTYIMPVMIFLFAFKIASAISLYWTVGNAFQVAQTLLLNNPFKIMREREAKLQEEKNRIKARRKAMKKAKRK